MFFRSVSKSPLLEPEAGKESESDAAALPPVVPPRSPDIYDKMAAFLERRPRWIAGAAIGLGVASLLLIVLSVRFASDVLDLLPQHFDSVKVFKVYDRQFSQARELTFGLLDESGAVDLDAYAEEFGGALRAEPWVARVLDRSPLESEHGLEEVQKIAGPLLLNLPPEQFAAAVTALEPEKIRARIARLRSQLEAGSPKAEYELQHDPLGIVEPALKPLSSSVQMQDARPLGSPDGTLRIVNVMTRQKELSAQECREIMTQVEAFMARMRSEGHGRAPEIMVTGRTPYVAELSHKMQADVISTLVTSALLVTGVFLVGFRRLRPLLSIMQVLLLCCVVAVAAGALVFHELNMITIGLCSILIGLGVDFGMVLFSLYQAARKTGIAHEQAVAETLRHHASAIVFGAATTAAAFLTLLLSGCAGFMQLGVLIAFGIACAAAFMLTVFFIGLGMQRFAVVTGGERSRSGLFVDALFVRPKWVLGLATLVLAGLTAYGFGPWGRIIFETDMKSLEPQDSRAGTALRTITKKMARGADPVIALVEAPSREEAAQRWQSIHERAKEMVQAGLLRSAVTPAALVLSPERVAQNAAVLPTAAFAAARTALEEAIAKEGLSAEAFQPALETLDALGRAAAGDRQLLQWDKVLPPDSSWWFVFDRFFGKEAGVTAGYIFPAAPLQTFAEKETIRTAIETGGVRLSGWAYTLTDLVPWAKGKLVELTLAMVALNALLLYVLYRRFFPLAVLGLAITLAMGALAASLKILGVPLNLFNVLAFPLVLGVGVDYGIYVLLGMRSENPRQALEALIRPVVLSGLTTVAGFGSLIFAQNPVLRGLGAVCSLGVLFCLAATFFIVLPLAIWKGKQ